MNIGKQTLKRLVLIIAEIIVSPLTLLDRLGQILGADHIFSTIGTALSLIPGKVGSYLRLAYYKGSLQKISSDVYIGFGSYFSKRSAQVGRNVQIGAYCILGDVEIKDDVRIASRVSIPSGKFQHGTPLGLYQDDERNQFSKVRIGYRTWIGEGAIVLADVGDDCIVGSGSIVTRSFPNGYLVAGNPARVIRKLELEKSKIKIKVLYLIDELNPAGTENQLILLVENLDKDKYEPVIGILRSNKYLQNLTIKTPVIDFKNSGYRGVKNIKLIYELKKHIENERYDIVQTQFMDSAIYCALAIRLLSDKPILIGTRRNLYHWREDAPWLFRSYKYTARWLDGVLANSYSVSKLCAELEGVSPDNITTIQNGIELSKYNSIPSEKAKEYLGIKGASPVVGVLANWRPVKGLKSFIAAAKTVLSEFPDALFILAGSGKQKSELESLARNLDIYDSVMFIEKPSEINTIISAFDIAVQPSLSESFSNVLLEYMAVGKPIVATRVGDADRVITDGKEGLLVDPNNPEMLSRAILDLCRKPEVALEMGKRARMKVEKNWSLGKIVKLYDEYYQSLVIKE